MWSEVFFDELHCSCHIRFITHWQHIRVFTLISCFFWPADKHTVFSFTPVISQSKVYLNLRWNRKTVSFRFSWAITETWCPLLGVTLAFLLPDFLTTLQMSSIFLSVRTLSLLGLASPCSLTSNLAALRLNSCWIYIFWSFEAKVSGPHALCAHRIPMYWSQGIIIWQRVPSWGIYISKDSASGSTCFSSWGHFIIYVRIAVYYVFTFCGIWVILLLRINLRLFYTFLLWCGCQVSHHWSGHLCSGQTMSSTTNASCYCHCNGYSSSRGLQCWLMIIISIPQLSALGSPLHLFNTMILSPLQANCWHHSMRNNWFVFILPSTLGGLRNTVCMIN